MKPNGASVLLGAMLLCMAPRLIAQTAMDSIGASRHTIYLSAWGHGGLYSVNYDRAWRIGANRMSISIGATYLPHIGKNDPDHDVAPKYSLPLQWNFFHGAQSTMEHGLGFSLWSGWNAVERHNIGSDHDYGPVRSTALYAFIKPIGYRLQPKHRGFFLRAHALLAIKLHEFDAAWERYSRDHSNAEQKILLWPGLDLGYSFGRLRKK